jgi:hypothetical protein
LNLCGALLCLLRDDLIRNLGIGGRRDNLLSLKVRLHSVRPSRNDLIRVDLSLSYWTVRGLVQSGKLETVEFPRADDTEPIRRVLIDRVSLDEFVDRLRRSRRPD